MNSLCLIVIAALAIASVSSRPQFSSQPIPILEQYADVDERGQYSIRYRSGDGTVATELGKLKPNADGSDYVLVKEGVVSYISPEGRTITINYEADEYGYRASGDHLPVAPTV